MSYRKILARNLKVAAAERDTSLTAVTQATGQDKQYLNRRLNGTTTISLEDLLNWAEFLDVPLTRLLNGVSNIEHHQENGDGVRVS